MYAKKVSPWTWGVPLIIAVVLVAAVVYGLTQFVIVDFQFYPRHAEVLDLRDQPITVAEYQSLSRKLPETKILWNIPFQGSQYSSDTESMTVTSLTEADVAALTCFTELKTLDATACTDYAQILALREHRPELEILYQIQIGGQVMDLQATTLTLGGIAETEIPWLDYLENLKTITVTAGGSGEGLSALQEYCHQRGLGLNLQMCGITVADDSTKVTLRGVTDEELQLLALLTELESIHLASPKASLDHIISLGAAYSGLQVTWDQTIGDMVLTSDMEEVDLSSVTLTSVEEVERAMAYLPNAKQVFLGLQDGLDNQAVADFRERNRDSYKVVWVVRFGDKRTARTDITYFKPGHDWVGGPTFGDSIAYNLRYCEDLICVDVGHLGSVKHVDWLEGLVNLEYLILAHTDVRSLEGIQNCKKLKFLELDWTGIRDLTPLKECTALEDLNIGMAYPDVTPLMEMPWLRNVWMISGSSGAAYRLSQALPDTHVVTGTGVNTVGKGWRNLPNYYAMRDAMNAPYMS